MTPTNSTRAAPREERLVTVDGVQYAVRPVRLAKSWALRYEGLTVDASDPEVAHPVWATTDGDTPQEIRAIRLAAAELSLRCVRLAYPEVYVRGRMTRQRNGDPSGIIEYTRCPDVIAAALRIASVAPVGSMAQIGAALTRRVESGECPTRARPFARVLAAALTAEDVDEQLRWATWAVDEDAAAAAEVAAIEARRR
jgi:hypothetical protein